MSYEAQSPAKINLGLSIKGKRSDGYHELETVFYPVLDLFDVIEMKKSKDLKNHLEVKGLTIEGNPEENLCLKAWQELKYLVKDLPCISLKIQKNIPMGAGLGGGSSNAAIVLKGLISLFSLNIEAADLHQIAKKLGADVPFFLGNKAVFATGIGTDFHDIHFNLPGILKIHPMPFHSNTVLAYKGLSPKDFSIHQDVKKIIQTENLALWRAELKNDFEPSVFTRFPELREKKEELYKNGASYVSMSGSGSALFSIWD